MTKSLLDKLVQFSKSINKQRPLSLPTSHLVPALSSALISTGPHKSATPHHFCEDTHHHNRNPSIHLAIRHYLQIPRLEGCSPRTPTTARILSTMNFHSANGNGGELRNRAHKICCEFLGGAWAKISPSEMSFTPVSGGMSNKLYCCTLPDSVASTKGEPFQALLRLYGDKETDMTLQIQILELLSERDLGPKLYGTFDDGRLEEFLPAASLTCEELMDGDISAIIARKLAAVHSLSVPNMAPNNTWLLDRCQEWLSVINDHKKLPAPYSTAALPETTLKIARKLLSINFEKEINFLLQVFDGTQSPIVFSHNDLHQGNILLSRPTRRRSKLDKRVILIDFEYCSYNYRAYDIANHFCEWCFEYDTPEYPHFSIYPDRFPSIESQRQFVRSYLDQQRRQQMTGEAVCTDSFTNGNYLCDNNNRGVSKNYNGSNFTGTNYNNNTVAVLRNGSSASNHEIDEILNEVKPFCIAANLIWTLWSVKSAYSSSIKFGYWEHAWTRWQFYCNLKRLLKEEGRV